MIENTNTVTDNTKESLRDFLGSPKGEKLINELEKAASFTEKRGGFNHIKLGAYYVMAALVNRKFIFEAFNYAYAYGYRKGFEKARKEPQKNTGNKLDISHFRHVLLDADNLVK